MVPAAGHFSFWPHVSRCHQLLFCTDMLSSAFSLLLPDLRPAVCRQCHRREEGGSWEEIPLISCYCLIRAEKHGLRDSCPCVPNLSCDSFPLLHRCQTRESSGRSSWPRCVPLHLPTSCGLCVWRTQTAGVGGGPRMSRAQTTASSRHSQACVTGCRSRAFCTVSLTHRLSV